MHIGILETGRPPEDLKTAPSYAKMLEILLDQAAPGAFTYTTYAVVDGHFPSNPGVCEGWLITGSKHGVYEDLPWMAPLKGFLHKTVSQGVPVVGICFGHQILAAALGGRVELASQGWGVGLHRYQLSPDIPRPAWMEGFESDDLRLNAMHEDQVVELAPNTTVLASSAFCPHAVLAYGDKALSFQGHPEFTAEFEEDLLRLRQGEVVPEEVAGPALKTLTGPDRDGDAAEVGRWMARFLLAG